MKNLYKFFIFIVGILISVLAVCCINSTYDDNWKSWNLPYFSFETPPTWQVDSNNKVLIIKGDSIKANMVFNTKGDLYPILIVTPEEYLELYTSNISKINLECLFCNDGVTYAPSWDIDRLKKTSDTSKKFEPIIQPKFLGCIKLNDTAKKIHNNADYICTFSHKDSIVTIPVTVPSFVKKYSYKIDTVDGLQRKIYFPRANEKGRVGIYIKEINGKRVLSAYADSLNPSQYELIINVYKSIKAR